MERDTDSDWSELSTSSLLSGSGETYSLLESGNVHVERPGDAGYDIVVPQECLTQSAAQNVERHLFDSGMVRDIETGKTDYTKVLHGPMLKRWADHLTRNEVRYPDVSPGVPNWTLANGRAEWNRFRVSAFRHMVQWLGGDTSEDHAAAIFFNVNGKEYVEDKITV